MTCPIREYSLPECIEILDIPPNVAIKGLEDTVTKIFEKLGMSTNKLMIVAFQRIGKTTKTNVEFTNRKDPELFLEIRKY